MAQPKFKRGDKVFAKVRGYPPWPARVDAVADETPNKIKYHIYFYGTCETAITKQEELYPYVEYKDKFAKPMKKKGFNEGLEQIELELGNAKPVFNVSQNQLQESDSDEDTLVIDIDETAQGSAHRKSIAKTQATPLSCTSSKGVKRPIDTNEDPGDEAKRGSSSARKSQQKEDSPKMGGEVTRFGRKIKPKKFSDNEYEYPDECDTTESRRELGLLQAEMIKPNSLRKVVKGRSSNSSQEKAKPSSEDSAQGDIIVDAEIEDQILTAVSPSGQVIKIDLNFNCPTIFKSDKARIQWKATSLKNAENLKKLIEEGDPISEDIQKEIKARLVEQQKKLKLAKKSQNICDKQQKLAFLKIEAQLLDMDVRIKTSLTLSSVANPDTCLMLLEDLQDLSVTPLMLKKHPEVMGTVRKLQKYVGNTSEWNLSREDVIKFDMKAAMIRQKAKLVFNKFKALFTVPQGKSFWQVFESDVKRFNEKTEHLHADVVCALAEDPAV